MSYRGYRNPGLGVVGYLIITCVIIWIAVSINKSLLSLLAFTPYDLLHFHQPWTIITSIFVHFPIPNFTHILFNMVTLYFFGMFFVNLVGDRIFLLVFFIGGLVGNLVFMWLASPFSAVIGASGAIFAIGGALAVMRPRLPVFIFPIPAPIPMWVAVLGGLLLSFFAADIAWQAHVGGLAAGLVAGYILRRREIARYWQR